MNDDILSQSGYSKEVPTLLNHHFAQLLKSGISIEVIKQRGYGSIINKKELEHLGFFDYQQRTPCLLIPQYSVDGRNEPFTYQIRPDKPRLTNRNGKAKTIKYETIADIGMCLDILPASKPMLQDTKIPLWFTEGSKKADALTSQGQCAISLSGVWNFKRRDDSGSSVLMADFDYIPLKDRLCYLCFDSDWQTNSKVRQAISRLAEHLRRKGAAVLFIPLPMNGNEKNGVDDFLVAGHTIEDVIALANEKLEAPAVVRKSLLPKIACNDRSLGDKTNDSFAAIIAKNSPPFIFIRKNRAVQVVHNEMGIPFITELDENDIRCVLAEAATYVNKSLNGEVEVSPPMDVVKNCMARISLGQIPFPILRGLSEAPYIAENGDIVITPGYNAKTQILYIPGKKLVITEIPERPNEANVEASKNLLMEIICDFPFDSEASRTNCLAMLLTPIFRPRINGCVPLGIFDKPQQGTGASLLAGVVNAIATGRPAVMTSWVHDDAETEKRLATFLKQGQTIIIYDNAEGMIYSPTLCVALTAPVIALRLLGGNESVEVHNQHIFIMTGNNIRLEGQLSRRSYRVGLDAQTARPWLRHVEYKHPDLIEWVLQKRGSIIAAMLTIYRAWQNAGTPKAIIRPKLASFQEWADLMSSILEFIGISGFLDNLMDMYEKNDIETPQWEAFLSEWYQNIGNTPVTCGELTSYLNDKSDFAAVVPSSLDRSDKSFTRKLGIALLGKLNVRYPCGLMLKKGSDKKHNAVTWVVDQFSDSLSKEHYPNSNVKGSLGSFPNISTQEQNKLMDAHNVGLGKDSPDYPSNVKQGSSGQKALPEPSVATKKGINTLISPTDDDIPGHPHEPCFACKGTDYWLRKANQWGKSEWVCQLCHPKPGGAQ